MASSSTDVVLDKQDGHRNGKMPRLEDVTAGDASTVLPMEVLPKFGQGIYTAVFRRRFHITVPGICNAGGKKSLLINTFALEPFVLGWRNDKPIKNNLWPINDSFPYLLFDSLNIRLSKFVPLMRTTHIGASTSDNVTFESSPYCMIAHIGKGQYTDIELDARTAKDMHVELLKFGSVFSRFDRFHEINDVELLGMQGEYTYHRKLQNAPMRYYFANVHSVRQPEINGMKMMRFPMDSHKSSFMGDVLNGWHQPTSDQPWLALAMPEVGALAESTNKINIYGSIMMETELKVHFYTDLPFSIGPNPLETITLEELVYNPETH
ncbi:hypothetical protein ACTXT7_017220, partial [Hymenolepis weldensis]